MNDDTLKQIKSLVLQKDSCVMATSFRDKPHCSLMVYAVNDTCKEIYMVTHKKGTKYHNLKKNPHVSLLMDTRDENLGKRPNKVLALTVQGEFEEISTEDRKREIRDMLLAGHPHLKDFMKDPNAEVFTVHVVSFLLLDGLTKAHFQNADER